MPHSILMQQAAIYKGHGYSLRNAQAKQFRALVAMARVSGFLSDTDTDEELVSRLSSLFCCLTPSGLKQLEIERIESSLFADISGDGGHEE